MYPTKWQTFKNSLWFLATITLGASLGAVVVSGVSGVGSLAHNSFEGGGALGSTVDFLKSGPVVYEALAREAVSESSVRVHMLSGGSVKNEQFAAPAEGKAINVNLDSKELTLYDNGVAIRKYEVLSIGREGTPWETPAGQYKVRSREESHFSSIGRVYMPYSMQFFGNYFIHGWPYHPDGTPVSEGYSGGCIRLSEEDAKEIYSLTDMGTMVNIERESSPVNLLDDEGYYYSGENKAPNVSKLLPGKAYLVADLDTGEILYEKNKSKILPVASITKLVTALTSLEVINQYQDVTVTKKSIDTEGEAGSLVVGQQLTAGALIYPLLLESSNDAAEALARHHGRDLFIQKMNQKAYSIGLSDTHFEDPSGLSVNNRSTVEDLFKLARYINRNKRYVYEVTGLESKVSGVNVAGKDSEQEWINNNRFVRFNHDNYVGGKGGYTNEASGTLISIFELPLSEFESRTIAIIVLGDKKKYDNVAAFVDYLKESIYYGTPGEDTKPI